MQTSTLLSLLLNLMSLHLGKVTADTDTSSETSTSQPQTVAKREASASNSNACYGPNDPTQKLCGSQQGLYCPEGLICNDNKGRCACPGNMVYSPFRCKCSIRAGGHGCSHSGDCSDGAHCYHPGLEVYCQRHYGLFFSHRHCMTTVERPTECHCCSGHYLGSDGVCPSADCQALRANMENSAESGNSNEVSKIITIVLIAIFYFSLCN